LTYCVQAKGPQVKPFWVYNHLPFAMPNRGKLVFNEKREFEQKFVYNSVKRVLDIPCTSKTEKKLIERPIQKVAHQVLRLMAKHEGATDVGRILDELSDVEVHARAGLQTQLPKTLGRKFAREILEELLGHGAVLDPTQEYVHHGERPGKPAPVSLYVPDEASPGPSACNSDSDSDADELDDFEEEGAEDGTSVNAAVSVLPSAIYLIEFKRSPKELLVALTCAPNDLAECRDALVHQGFNPVLKGGAKIFVRPEHYPSVVAYLKGRPLKPRHVVIAAEFEANLNSAISDIGKGVIAKAKTPVSDLVVKRTFIDIPMPSSLRSEPNSDPATMSTTDGNPRIVIRPRRA